MKILFFTSPGQDNLEDGILHGLRMLLGADCVDYPKKEVLYKNFSARPADQCYGRLFTLWRTLDDIPIDRIDIENRLKRDEFDYVIFGAIHRTQPFFQYYEPFLKREKTILLDGEDDPGVFVAARNFLCFKREIQRWGAYYYYRHGERIRTWRYGRKANIRNLLPISFAIPTEKITRGIRRVDKTQAFPTHIVDDEIKNGWLHREGARPETSGNGTDHGTIAQQRGYIIESEGAYYRDLQQSRFGITMKKGGWDCLRHYEIAANGSVICFRQLDQKPPLCPPYGLNRTNSICYSSARDLRVCIETMTDADYDALQAAGYDWIQTQTTEVQAQSLLTRAQLRFQK